MRAMFGTRRPYSSRCAFQFLSSASSWAGSWPRSSRRTGCADSGVTRYWYQLMSHAIVITTSPLTPESGRMLAFGVPRLFAIPPTVRRKSVWLKRSAASTTASSGSERRRKIGSSATGASATADFRASNRPESDSFRRGRSVETVGVVGLPSFSQPESIARSWQSGHTSTKFSPSGEKRVALSPISRVRSQTAHLRAAAWRVIRIRATITSATRPIASSDGGFLLLPLRLCDHLLRDVRGNLFIACEAHVVVPTAARKRGQRLRVGEDLGHRHLGLDRRHPALRLHPQQAPAP